MQKELVAIQVRLTEEERDTLKRAAELKGVLINEILRDFVKSLGDKMTKANLMVMPKPEDDAPPQ